MSTNRPKLSLDEAKAFLTRSEEGLRNAEAALKKAQAAHNTPLAIQTGRDILEYQTGLAKLRDYIAKHS